MEQEHGIWKYQTFVEKVFPKDGTLQNIFICVFAVWQNVILANPALRSCQCGQNGCKELHHSLLHRQQHDINPKPIVTETLPRTLRQTCLIGNRTLRPQTIASSSRPQITSAPRKNKFLETSAPSHLGSIALVTSAAV